MPPGAHIAGSGCHLHEGPWKGGGDTGEPSSICHPEMSLQDADLCEISAPEALSPLWGLVVKQAVVC